MYWREAQVAIGPLHSKYDRIYNVTSESMYHIEALEFIERLHIY